MRRLSLSTKLFAAALPLVVAVGGLLALTVRSDLNDIDSAESGAELGGVWEPLITALTAVETESASLTGGDADDGVGDGAGDGPALVADPDARRATDQAINDLRTSIEKLGAFEAASAHVTAGRSALSAARRNIDMAAIAPQMAGDVDPVEAYAVASREFVAVGQLLPSEAGDAQLGSELLAVVKLAEAKLHANDVIAGTSNWPNDTGDKTPLAQARASFASLRTTLGEFEAIAPDEWAAQFRQSGYTTSLGRFGTSLDSVARAADADRLETFDTAEFAALIDEGVEFQRTISDSIVERANAQADATRSSTLTRIGVILGAILLAALTAWFITRSITRRVKAVANSANLVASEQLPALVEALRDPRGKAVLPEIAPVDAKGGDDLADLAHAFNSMQETLVDVAHQQVEVLRRGVSDIFITMARRNRSLIDRQLSMLDEFEAGVDDPDVLSNFYQLDHLATRMRRNSESLLVLANAEPKRRRVKATEIDDVVRASIGEVEDYRRVEIQHLESLQVRGNVVADVSHLLAELLDNATSFSPPGSPVRIGGRKAGDSYMIRIVDDGVGIAHERLQELNELLREPPIVGLSVESTLGISVVSLLANKHHIEVTLSAGSPGLTVDVVLPSSLFGPMDAPAPMPDAPAAIADVSTHDVSAHDVSAHDVSVHDAVADPVADPVVNVPEPARSEQVIAWNDHPDGPVEEMFQITDPATDAPPATQPIASPTVEPTLETIGETAPAATPEPATSSPELDWAAMSLDLNAFTIGSERYAESAPDATPEPSTEQSVSDQPVADAEHSVAEHTFAEQPVADAEPTFAEQPVDEQHFSEQPVVEQPVVETPSMPDAPSVVEPIAETPSIAEPIAPPAPAGAIPHLPPPLPSRTHGEFNVPPAPPITADPLTRRPVSPDTARPAPVPTAFAPQTAGLPTRTQRGTGPDGPDRITDTGSAPVTTSEPGALQAALAAFEAGRSAVTAKQAEDLPTRVPVEEAAERAEDPQVVTQSRVDPSALRDRLRAFQSEFSSANSESAGGPDIYTDQNTDLGGDPR
jgi:signal transduction histidine kinase